jgi:Tfp pilus assembly protein PilF
MSARRRTWTGAPIALAAALIAVAPPPSDQLARHRNLGKAFYENPTTQAEAVAELKRALDLAPDSVADRVNYALALLQAGQAEEGVAQLERAQREDPSLPHTWFNLGIAYKRQAEHARAAGQLERMVQLVPDEPVARFNLGYLYLLAGRQAEGLEQLRRAAALDPNFKAPRYQLFTAFQRAAPNSAQARGAYEEFDVVRRRQEGAAVPEDPEWSVYSELVDVPDPAAAREADAPPAPAVFAVESAAVRLDPQTAGLAVLDAEGDGRPDLLAWSSRGLELLRGGRQPVAGAVPALAGARTVALGDWDNDGLGDLCVLTADGARLLRNAGGRFEPAALDAPAAPYGRAVWLDYDHDYDLDLLLFGPRSVLMRNHGRAGFGDATPSFPFVHGRALDAALLDVVAWDNGHDLVVTYEEQPAVLYRDRLAGVFEAAPLDVVPAASRLLAEDLDYDGETDVLAGGPSGLTLLRNRGRRFEAMPLGPPARAFVLADVRNQAAADVITTDGAWRNRGAGLFTREAPGPVPGAVALAAADFDGDGALDLAAVDGEGHLRLARNRTPAGSWLQVSVEGVKNLKLASGARIEVKAGARYQKKRYDGAPLHFGLRAYEEADAVRITWPNGLIQNEIRQPVRQRVAYKERPRLSGSCPMIFTWDGSGFRFITDVLGVAPLGASAGDGSYFPVDHDEYVQVPAAALRARDGHYEVRMTEELREVTYLDLVELIALDHPAGVDVVTNDKFKGPPFPEFRLYALDARVFPVRAVDGRGHDVRDRVRRRDASYADGFARTPSGVAEMHFLELDFGRAAPDGRAVLVLSGWVDWADGSTFRGVSQEDPRGLVMPFLQARGPDGQWKTVLEDMGMPAGKPKTIAVDLTGLFPTPGRELRIGTNLALYWDEIFLAQPLVPAPVRLTPLGAAEARLAFRGFSRPLIDPQRRQPEAFDYAEVSPVSMWNPTPGLYTRYGDVRPLVAEVDDRLVIMGSGDELALRFPAGGLPPLPAGWTREFLVRVDGWAKDADLNTAFSQTVAPLPFHGMSAYPYPAPERFPDGEVHREYVRRYNTRPALRLLRPLAPRPAAAPPEAGSPQVVAGTP